jgi:hypothetical protein
VLDTDRYVQTLEPLAADPGVQDAVVTVVEDQITGRLDVTALLDP